MSAKVRINYASGISEEFDVDKFTFKKDNTGKEVEWVVADNAKQRPLYFNMDAVESIWELL